MVHSPTTAQLVEKISSDEDSAKRRYYIFAFGIRELGRDSIDVMGSEIICEIISGNIHLSRKYKTEWEIISFDN